MSSSPSRAPLDSGVFEWAKVAVIPTRAGERRDFFDTPTRTFRNLECHATTLKPGERAHDPHRHADEELIVVKGGKIEATINGAASVAGPGSILFFASNDLHGMRNAGDIPATYHVIRIVTADTPSR